MKIPSEIFQPLKNGWTQRCPFCESTPKDRKAGIHRPTKPGALKNLQTAPLHVLLRSGEGFFNAGFRNMAGVHKHSQHMSVDEHDAIDQRYLENKAKVHIF